MERSRCGTRMGYYKIFWSMKKTISTLIDELITTNIKIFVLVDKVQKNEHTKEDAKKIQDLNSYRTELCNALNEEFDQTKVIKISGSIYE